LLCSCLSGHGVSWSLNRKREPSSLVPLISRSYSLRFFLLGVLSAAQMEWVLQA
jgi:hypothetical protein